MTSFGINFAFEENINEQLSEFLKLGDQENLNQFGAKIKQALYRHQLEINGKLLNGLLRIEIK